MKVPTLNRNIARKVLKTVDKGLVFGMGNPIPGQMCVEAAVCYALGLPHGDDPKCVGKAVRRFKIDLNDQCNWDGKEDRAKGLRRVAIAQLGSNKVNQQKFTVLLLRKVIEQVLMPTLTESDYKYRRMDLRESTNEEFLCRTIVGIARDLSNREDGQSTDMGMARLNAFNMAIYALMGQTKGIARIVSHASDYAQLKAGPGSDKTPRSAVLHTAAECAVQALTELKAQGVAWLDLTKPQKAPAKKVKASKKVATKHKK